MSTVNKIKVGISIGDYNGIGMEVIIKTLLDNRMLDNCIPIVYGSSKVASYHRKALDVSDFSFNLIKKAEDANPKKANLINCWEEETDIELGVATETAGKYAFKSLQLAVEDLASNKVDVLVTAPINKDNMPKAEFPFAGHTEYLANYANEENPLMILANDGLRVGVVTGHIPLKDVASTISKELIVKKIRVFAKSLQYDFAIRKPKIAVLGLNPHAGDNGKIGDEDINVIAPAIEQAASSDYLVYGPYPADGLFGSSNFMQFDGILAMYHDQGLVPFKALSFGEGVNYTAGLPIVRTSPDHGTGYEIAGKNIANPSSFRKAIFQACDIYKTRQNEKELNANPLPVKQQRKER